MFAHLEQTDPRAKDAFDEAGGARSAFLAVTWGGEHPTAPEPSLAHIAGHWVLMGE